MKQEIINVLNAEEAQRLYHAYSTICKYYELLFNGPRGCRGIVEYHAAYDSMQRIYSRYRELIATMPQN